MENKKTSIMKQPELGKRIFELRKQHGLTQEELVERCNISVRTIQRIESGEVTPRSFTVKSILNALGLELSEVFSEEAFLLNWSKKELSKLNISWIAGIFVTVLFIVGIIIEVYLGSTQSVSVLILSGKVILSIIICLAIYHFLSGYKILANKFKNPLLAKATVLYLVLNIVISIIMIVSSYLFNSEDSLYVIFSIISIFLFGVSELVLGLGVLKLKEDLGSFALVIGVLKIINGAMLMTVLLSLIALFLVIPVLILELVFIFNISQKGKNY